MHKRSLKHYFSTLIVALTLASCTFAGDIQCPIVPPPPPEEGRGLATNTSPADTDDSQILNDIWEFISQRMDLF